MESVASQWPATAYVVRRTSQWDFDQPPCDGAFRVPFVDVDVRDVDDPKKIPAYRGTDGDWYQRGTNHRVVDGRIMRDVGVKLLWCVLIPDIRVFIETHGRCVLSVRWPGQLEVEIYDDYRE